MERTAIANLSSLEYEHPLDRIALENLKKVPILPKLIEVVNIPYNTLIRGVHSGSNLRINERQMPSVYKRMREACEILEVDEPEFYLGSERDINAYTACPDKPIVRISRGCLEDMDDDELMFVLGHELAHIKSEHITYSTLARILSDGMLEVVLSSVPGLGLASGGLNMALNYALFTWYQSAELTCDRGGYLVSQNFTASCTALMKLAGFSQKHINELSLDEFINQARNFENIESDTLGSVQKIILSYMAASHPYTVSRVHELLKFEEGGTYSDILQRKTKQDFTALPEAEADKDTSPASTQNASDTAKDALDKTKGLAGGVMSRFKK